MPWYVETRLIYYRKDLADKAGLTPPADWQGLKDFAKGMQDKGGAKWGIYLQPGGQGSWQTFMPFAWQKGAELVRRRQVHVRHRADEGGARLLRVASSSDGISPTAAARRARWSRRSSTGDIGAFVSGPWHMGILREQGGADFEGKWAVAPMPKEEARHVVHRWWRPRGLQGVQEP